MSDYRYEGKLFSGSALDVARKLRGMTRKDVAEAIGTTTQRIADLETDRKAPSAQEVLLLAAVLEQPYGFFSHEFQPLDWRDTSLKW